MLAATIVVALKSGRRRLSQQGDMNVGICTSHGRFCCLMDWISSKRKPREA
jgi:hypothetical protein